MSPYLWIIFFLIVGIVFAGGALATNFLLRPKRKEKKGLFPYECGELPISPFYIQYDVKYYLYAFIFLIFEVEIIFLIPWALILRSSPISPLLLFIEMMIFIIILLIGLLYAFQKQALKWE